MRIITILYTSIFVLAITSCNEPDIQIEQMIQEQTTHGELKAATIGTNYFISTTGNDSNPGTEVKPFQTIAKAASVANPGDVITVENGTYTTVPGGIFANLSRSGTSSNYITYRARSKGGAILDGKNNSALRGINIPGSYINFEGFEMKGVYERFFVISGKYINIRDIHAHHNAGYCTDTTEGLSFSSVTSTANTILFERCLIHDIGRLGPGESGCSPATKNYMAHDQGIYCSGVSNLTIQNCFFYNIRHGFALQVYDGSNATSTNIRFINNTCENGNPYHPAGHVLFWGNCNGALVANNIFKDQYQSAIQVYQGSYIYSNILITNNITRGGDGTISTGTATGLTIANNDNNTDPLFVDEINHNYALQPSSPANKSGYATGITTDYLNNVRTSPNIGAFASSGSSSTVYYNSQISATATKNDCGTGYSGSTVTYTISSKKYSSTISQTDADNKALADLSNNKQAWANSIGTCTISPVVYYSVQTIGYATKNDCGTGYTGSTVQYNILAGAYSSTISQVDANNMAIADMNWCIQSWANSHGTCTLNPVVYYSVKTIGYATKNDCGSGYTGSSVQYTINAGAYTSSISQADANNKAISDMNFNKQSWANSHGYCILIP